MEFLINKMEYVLRMYALLLICSWYLCRVYRNVKQKILKMPNGKKWNEKKKQKRKSRDRNFHPKAKSAKAKSLLTKISGPWANSALVGSNPKTKKGSRKPNTIISQKFHTNSRTKKRCKPMLEMNQTPSKLARAYVEKQWKSIKLTETNPKPQTKQQNQPKNKPARKFLPPGGGT